MVWLLDGEKMKICSLVSTEYTNVAADRHRTTAQAALMHNIARKKMNKFTALFNFCARQPRF